MRLSLSAATLSATLPLLSLAQQATFSSPQVYLHPSPPSSQSSSSSPAALTAAQAKAVLAHHLGHSHDFSLTEIVGEVGDWTRLMFGAGAGGGEREDKARVLVVQGVEDPSDFTDLSPSFTLSDSDPDSISSLLAPYLSRASTFLSHALDSLPSSGFMMDIFDVNPSESIAKLKTELTALVAWGEGLIPKSDGNEAEVLTIDGLRGLDRDGEEYDAASGAVSVAIGDMQDSQTPFVLILTPFSTPNVAHLARRAKKADPSNPLPPPKSSPTGVPTNSTPNQNASFYPGPVFSTNLCLTSFDACNNYTDSCSGRGTCGETKRGGKSCWTCSCRVENDKKYGRIKWSGVSCEKQDVSEAFVLIVFTVLLGFFLTVGSIMMLYGVGSIPLPSVLSAGAAPAGKN